jgi:restriction endonuclease Mrr
MKARKGPRWADYEHMVKHISLRYCMLGGHEKIEVKLYLLYNMLEDRFKEYHLAKLNDPVAITDTAELSGVEFETYVARIFMKCGYQVSGTRATGDQGADLIAERDSRKIIIQAKRYDGAVGNKAVQEVIGALSFYGGDEGWVVTNSTFTQSAKALAQKANVKLIDGAQLANIEKLSLQEKEQTIEDIMLALERDLPNAARRQP